MTYAELTTADTDADIRNDFRAFYDSLTHTEQRILRENPDSEVAELLASVEGMELS